MKKEFAVDVQWFGKAATDKVLETALKGLKQAGLAVAGESRRKAPVLSGTLMRSICVSDSGVPDLEQTFEKAKTRELEQEYATGSRDELAVYISANTPYAHKQHEENKNHSKFLERALQDNANKIEKYVKQELKKL